MGKKIAELTQETSLTDSFMLITEDKESASPETKYMLLSTLLNYIKADNVFNIDLSQLIEGNSITITKNADLNTATFKLTFPDWISNTDYTIGDYVLNENKIYKCTVNHTSGDIFDENNWTIIGGSVDGGMINNWSADTNYTVGDLVINGTTIYQCHIEHISSETFDSANWTSMTGEKGEKGDKGEDGVSPTVSAVQTETGATITITDSTETTTVDIANGFDGITPHIDETTKHWIIDEEDTGIVAEGKNGITTIQTTSVKYSGVLTVDDWIGDTAPYTQTVIMDDITSNVIADFGIVITKDNVEIGLEEKKQWGYVTSVETIDGGVIFYCFKNKPSIALNYQMRVV